MKKNFLSVKDIRAAVKQLKNCKPLIPFEGDFALTVGGAVIYGGGRMYIHPEYFKDMFGEEAFQELLKKPRIVSEYDIEVGK